MIDKEILKYHLKESFGNCNFEMKNTKVTKDLIKHLFEYYDDIKVVIEDFDSLWDLYCYKEILDGETDGLTKERVKEIVYEHLHELKEDRFFMSEDLKEGICIGYIFYADITDINYTIFFNKTKRGK